MSQPQNPNADAVVARVNNPGGADLIQVTPAGGGVAWRLNQFQNQWYSGTPDPVTANVVGMVTGSLYVDTMSGNMWQYSGTAWTQIPGTGSQIYSEVGTAGFRDDFISNNITSSGGLNFTTTLPGSFVGDTAWGALAVNGSGDTAVGVLSATNSSFPNLGAVQFFQTSASLINRGMAIYKDGSGVAGTLGALRNNANWQVDIILALPPMQDVCFCAGVCGRQVQLYDPPLIGFFVRFDSAQSDADFTWVVNSLDSPETLTSTANSIPPDGSFHHFRISSVTPGTILFSVDGGAQTAIVAPSENDGNYIPFVQFISRQNNASASLNLDFFSFAAATSRT